MDSKTPISVLSGVGPTRVKQLAKLGLNTLGDLVYNFPRLYEERGNVLPVAYADFNSPYAFILTVASEVKSNKIKNGLTISKIKAFDDSGAVEIVFFNAPYVKDVFHVGSQFRFFGKLSLSKKTLQLTNPKYEPYTDGELLDEFVPVYSLTQGLNSKFIAKLTRPALEAVIPTLVDPLPEDIRLKNNLATLSYSLKNIHFPTDAVALSKALRRLAFDEMMYFGMGVAMSSSHKQRTDGVRFSKCDLSPMLALYPYELTNGQKNAVNDIYRDTVLGSQGKVTPMARILVGDVGSGKTVCAALSMYICASSGFQSAMMAPTEILAVQHFNELAPKYASLGIKAELLIGATTQKEKKRIYAAIESGQCDIVIGTHALLSDKFSFKNLGLIITDEQHRFGVNQRAVLKDKAHSAHMLVMSATPIPRTLALTVYGDLDVSRISELPAGRQRVDTFVVDENYRERLDDFIKKQVALGGQVYVVCPAIEPTEDEAASTFQPKIGSEFEKISSNSKNISNVEDLTLKLKQNLSNLRIASLHGKMKSQEKDAVMNSFSKGEIDVLVSTTVIEVGVNVPNANLMIIENAERFGLSQLHQLRGRVGRGSRKSYCVLINGNHTQKSEERLGVMKDTYDGFEIAEKDLLLRGPGDFFSSGESSLRQSGGFSFKLASMCNDTELLSLAFNSAREIISKDPTLSSFENLGLRDELQRQFQNTISIIS